MDLSERLELHQVHKYVADDRIVYMSMTEEQGLEQLEKAITTVFFGGELESGDLTYVSNVRHIQLLHQAKSSLQDALQGAEIFTPIDLLQIDIRNAWEQLGEIIGDAVGESLVDQIFSQFCLGK
jgi:tRNA modification GTPase